MHDIQTGRNCKLYLSFRNLVGDWEKDHFKAFIKQNDLKNVKYHEFLSIRDLRKMQLENSVHICPSKREGFGHYINEARAVGALVIATNFPPMNEMYFNERSGLAINYKHSENEEKQVLGTVADIQVFVPSEAICFAIERSLRFTMEEKRKMGNLARQGYEQDRDFMRANWIKIGKELKE